MGQKEASKDHHPYTEGAQLYGARILWWPGADSTFVSQKRQWNLSLTH